VHSRCPSLQLCSTGNSFLMGEAQRPTGHDPPVARLDKVMEPLRLPVRTQDEEAEESGKSARAQTLSSWQGKSLSEGVGLHAHVPQAQDAVAGSRDQRHAAATTHDAHAPHNVVVAF